MSELPWRTCIFMFFLSNIVGLLECRRWTCTFGLSLHLDLTAFSAWSLFGDRDLLHPFPEMSRPMEVLSMQLLQACPVQMSTSLPSSIDQRCGHEMTHVQLGAFLLFQRFEGLVRKVSLHMSTDADLCNSSGPGFFFGFSFRIHQNPKYLTNQHKRQNVANHIVCRYTALVERPGTWENVVQMVLGACVTKAPCAKTKSSSEGSEGTWAGRGLSNNRKAKCFVIKSEGITVCHNLLQKGELVPQPPETELGKMTWRNLATLVVGVGSRTIQGLWTNREVQHAATILLEVDTLVLCVLIRQVS